MFKLNEVLPNLTRSYRLCVVSFLFKCFLLLCFALEKILFLTFNVWLNFQSLDNDFFHTGIMFETHCSGAYIKALQHMLWCWLFGMLLLRLLRLGLVHTHTHN